MSTLEHVHSSQNILGEGPVWNEEEQALYWVDIEGKTINRYWPGTGKAETFEVGLKVGVFAFRKQGGLIVASENGLGFWDPDSNQVEIFANPEAEKEGARFNDGKVDRKGRFWAGTMTPEGATSSLYRVSPDLEIEKMESGITISNGMGWSPDNKTMYFTDTMKYVIYAYDFDIETGSISNRRDFVRFPEDGGVPDGMTVDSEGYLWTAMCLGGRLLRVSPDGEISEEIKLPVTLPTSVTFGGKDYQDMYITSGWTTLSDEERENNQPQAGDLFLLRPGVKGIPEPKFAG